jgi:molecular chaperone DnaK (HSP70)
MSQPKDIVVGIDLGTTNSLIAWCDESGPQLIREPSGEARVPSVLAFGPDGRVTIGWEAKAHAVEQPTSTVFSIKRLMGRGYDELTASGERTTSYSGWRTRPAGTSRPSKYTGGR